VVTTASHFPFRARRPAPEPSLSALIVVATEPWRRSTTNDLAHVNGSGGKVRSVRGPRDRVKLIRHGNAGQPGGHVRAGSPGLPRGMTSSTIAQAWPPRAPAPGETGSQSDSTRTGALQQTRGGNAFCLPEGRKSGEGFGRPCTFPNRQALVHPSVPLTTSSHLMPASCQGSSQLASQLDRGPHPGSPSLFLDRSWPEVSGRSARPALPIIQPRTSSRHEKTSLCPTLSSSCLNTRRVITSS